MADNTAVFLLYAWKETGGIDECNQGDVETITETNKSRHLVRRIYVKSPSIRHRLVGNDADRPPV
jgi:hypothetical protein